MLIVRSAVVGPFAENTWLLADEASGEAVLVDPGGELDRVLRLAEPGGLRVKRVFLTHGHIDHVAGAEEACRRLEAPCQLHPDDQPWLAALPQQAAMFGFQDCGAPPTAAPHADGDTFTLGDLTARVIHTPGHSAGSCCLWFEAARTLVAGDTLFAGSVGRTDLPGGDYDALERSIRERLLPLGDDVRVLCGHGPETTLGEERRTNPFVGEAAGRGRFL